MALAEGRRGAQSIANGTVREIRLGPTGSQVVLDAHAHFQEAVYNQRVFTASNPLAGTTVAAGGAVTNPLLAILNPVGSQYNLVLLKASFVSISGTVGPGIVGYYVGSAPAALAAANITPQGNMVGGGEPAGIGKAYAAVTNTLGATPSFLRAMMWFQAQAAGQTAAADLLDGEFVVPPGYAFAINPGATGTTWVAAASLTWEEVSI